MTTMMSDELLEVLRDNPGLPVYAHVSNELVDDDDYAWTFNTVVAAHVGEVIEYGDQFWDDRDELVDELLYDAAPETTAESVQAMVDGLPWIPCIWVDTTAGWLVDAQCQTN